MRTLLVALEYPPLVGGVETYYEKLAKYWPEEITVLDNSRGQLLRRGWWRGVFSVAAYIRSYKPEWVLVGEILPVGIMVYLVSWFLPFKYAVFLHGLDFSLATKSFRKRFITGRILRRADKILAVNSYTAAEIQRNFPELKARIFLALPGAEIEQKPSEASSLGLRHNYNLENAFLLVTVARFVKRKGVDMVLRALPTVIKHIPNLRYVIIGQGPDEEYLKRIIEELHLETHVIMLSGLDRENKNKWMAAADIFVMPARNINGDYEGFGIVYLEANLLGKPVIAGLSGGVGDAVVDGLNGLRVNEEDTLSIAEGILKLYDDKDVRERLGRQGEERAHSFEWKLQVKKIFAIIKEK